MLRLRVAYNAAFDRRFLHAEMARVPGLQARPPALEDDVVWIDPLVWARELQKQEARHRLVDVCARMGIALDDAHRAWADAEATGHVLNGLASEMPTSYGDLIRFQQRYGAEQEAQLAARRNRRR